MPKKPFSFDATGRRLFPSEERVVNAFLTKYSWGAVVTGNKTVVAKQSAARKVPASTSVTLAAKPAAKKVAAKKPTLQAAAPKAAAKPAVTKVLARKPALKAAAPKAAAKPSAKKVAVKKPAAKPADPSARARPPTAPAPARQEPVMAPAWMAKRMNELRKAGA